MARPAKDYPIKWIKKDSNQVTLMFPNAPSDGHGELNDLTRGPLQETMDLPDVIYTKQAKIDYRGVSNHKKTLIELRRHSERIEELIKACSNELTATNRLLQKET